MGQPKSSQSCLPALLKTTPEIRRSKSLARNKHASFTTNLRLRSHTIDDSDEIKINSFLRAAAAIEAAKRYMPAEVYKNLRSLQLLDEEGNSLGDALDAAGGKFMTRMHANNAKQSALSASGAMFLSKKQDPDSKKSLKRPNPENRVTQLAKILSVDPKTVWPETLGGTSDDTEEHAKNINNIRTLVESIAIGGRIQVPKAILIPLLNSIAEYMDKTTEEIDGKPILEGIFKVQGKAAAVVERRASTPARASTKPDGRQGHGNLSGRSYFGWTSKTTVQSRGALLTPCDIMMGPPTPA